MKNKKQKGCGGSEKEKLRADIQRIREETLGSTDETKSAVEELISETASSQNGESLQDMAPIKLEPYDDGVSIIDRLGLHEEFDVIGSNHEEWDGYSIMKTERKK